MAHAEPTPPLPTHCLADFCLIPLGTPTPSVSAHIAAVQRLVRASGVKHHMHSAGTTLEGSWEDVMRVIGQAHALMHETGVLRVQTDIRVGTRVDKVQAMEDKVRVVEELLREGEGK